MSCRPSLCAGGRMNRDVLKRYSLFIAGLVFTALFAVLGWLVSPWFLTGLVVAAPLAALGVRDWRQTRWTLTRNYPVAARIRWLALSLRPYLRAYIVEGDREGKPFDMRARNLIHARARGFNDTIPFGTELDTASGEYEWLGHSMEPANDPDRNPRIDIGGPQCGRPYNASVFNISAMSFGSLSGNAIEALNLGAAKGGFYHDTGEGGISPYHLRHGGDLVWELGTGYFGCHDGEGNFDPGAFAEKARMDQVRMVEIKLSQGAKPGHGGMLPGAKVTEEIAETRSVPVGETVISPNSHPAFSTPVELLEFAARLRELSGGKPVGVKLCVGQIHEVLAVMKAMLKTGILLDFIVVDGGEGGTGAAPKELSDRVGMPLTDGLVTVRNALVGTGLRDEVSLAASGKVFSGAGLARNFTIGADWCNAARAFMFSIGCIQAQRCHLDTCPTGVTTQDKGRQRGLVVDVQGPRAARFHAKTVEALTEILGAAGLTHPRELKPHHLVHRIGESDAASIDQVHDFLALNALLDAPEETIYADWWEAASADSFRAQIPLDPQGSRAPMKAAAD
ncbi:FMN-binding glutamate synthase family protein [Minwuia thermotolerans]|uniref:FMN-binding glutamate synthase family protein n=2 Tax=Minwuia thermotolerans TaxID=2056226 RepID=A0A2M9G326_9PROT|nr:FMN-binding glutamate synthase family protein [Minwuia thermotolerans]